MRACIGLVLAAACSVLPLCSARADTHTYVVAIGNNAAPTDTLSEQLEPLHYADDDAADFFELTRQLSQAAFLLTVLDTASQQRFPALSEIVRPPTMHELRRAIATLRQLFEADLRAGHDSVLLLFFSGHGTRGGRRPPGLTLLDQPLTQAILYDDVLAMLPARYIHLFIDACHAEAVVRPRDPSAQPVELTAEDIQTYAAHATLARFPQVGAVLATASGAEAHEWDVYERGVFSHELMSGLRGAADVDGDGKVEYSELSAFLGAANSKVPNPRVRLSIVVRPPALNAHATLVDVTRLRGSFRLVGRGDALHHVYVEDERGNRLVDFLAEPNHSIQLALPAQRVLFLHRGDATAELHAPAGSEVHLQDVRFGATSQTARAPVSAQGRGLFATAYGPRYYRGYVDQNQELAPVRVPDAALHTSSETLTPTAAESTGSNALLLGASAALSTAAIVLGVLAHEAIESAASNQFERERTRERDRALAFEVSALVTAGMAITVACVAAFRLAHGQTAPPRSKTASARNHIPTAEAW